MEKLTFNQMWERFKLGLDCKRDKAYKAQRWIAIALDNIIKKMNTIVSTTENLNGNTMTERGAQGAWLLLGAYLDNQKNNLFSAGVDIDKPYIKVNEEVADLYNDFEKTPHQASTAVLADAVARYRVCNEMSKHYTRNSIIKAYGISRDEIDNLAAVNEFLEKIVTTTENQK